jgi:hypothetical protein
MCLASMSCAQPAPHTPSHIPVSDSVLNQCTSCTYVCINSCGAHAQPDQSTDEEAWRQRQGAGRTATSTSNSPWF